MLKHDEKINNAITIVNTASQAIRRIGESARIFSTDVVFIRLPTCKFLTPVPEHDPSLK